AGLLKLFADVARAVGLGREIGGAERLRRHRGAEIFEQALLRWRRLAFRLHGRILEEALRAGVEAVEQISVGPLEIEGEVERLPHQRVFQLLASRVEEIALRS